MDLSIVIINYNTKNITIECINSVLDNTKNFSFEIILVDNASVDGSYAEFQKRFYKYPFIHLIKNNKNLGFAYANNIGAERAKGRYILFLNSDTVIKNSLFKEMILWMDKAKDVAVSSCALKNKDGSLQGSGGYFPTLSKVFAWMFFLEDVPFLDRLVKPFHPVHSKSIFYNGLGYFKKERRQDWVTGAFFLIKKEIFEKAGGFNPDYFMYTEEVDLCYRVKKMGYDIAYLPQWEIIHLGGASSTKEFPIISEYKGIKLFYKKNMPTWQYPLMRAFLKGGALIRSLIFGILDGKAAFVTYVKAFKIA